MPCTNGTAAPGQIVALNFSGTTPNDIVTPTLVTLWDASTVKAYVLPGGTLTGGGNIGSATVPSSITTKTQVASGVDNINVNTYRAGIAYNIVGSVQRVTSSGVTTTFGFSASVYAPFTVVMSSDPAPGGGVKAYIITGKDAAGNPLVIEGNSGGGCGSPCVSNLTYTATPATGSDTPGNYSVTIQWEGTACVFPATSTPPSGEPPVSPSYSPSGSGASYSPSSPSSGAPSVDGGNPLSITGYLGTTPSNATPPITYAAGCSDCATCPSLCLPVIPPVLPQYPPLFVFLPNGTYSPVSWNGYVLPISSAGFVEFGVPYPTLYASPVLASGMFSRRKRLKHVYLQFDNETGLEVHTNKTTSNSALYGKAQFPLDTNIYINYLNEGYGEPITDTYRYDSVRFNDALYSNHNSSKQIDERFTLFKEPLLGTSYGYQLGVYSLDVAAWRLVGWQVTAKMKGETVGEFNE
jgi:hypothetical protein